MRLLRIQSVNRVRDSQLQIANERNPVRTRATHHSGIRVCERKNTRECECLPRCHIRHVPTNLTLLQTVAQELLLYSVQC